MPPSDLFRSLEPLRNPIGFGAGDFIELTLAASLVLLILLRPPIEPYFKRLANRTAWCMLVLFSLPIVLRFALLSNHPVPAPRIYDEFSHLLVADTVRHFRLANPSHPLHQFFETIFVLQQPTYSSIYPLGQGFALAFGRAIFGHPWAGVVLSVAAFCALCYWMLRGWTTPAWALAGGLLTVFEFGPLNQWMNSFWGGGVSAVAGCLVFGALPRIRRSGRASDAAVLGVGLGMQLLTRPYESIFLVASVILFIPKGGLRRRREPGAWPIGVITMLAVLPAIGLTLLQNREVTGSWKTLPALMSQYQYGVPTTFTIQPNPIPHRALTPQQELSYKSQVSYHGNGVDTIQRFLQRIEYRVRFYRFFFLAPFYLALPAFLLRLREYRFQWVAGTALIFSVGSNFYPFFFPHYIAALTCLFVLVTVIGLQRWGPRAARILLALCAVHFLFWYSLHLFESRNVAGAMMRFETWDSINHGDADRRATVTDRLAESPGRQLVFVRYSPEHIFQDEWVYNEADIDGARVVWARDLGPRENEKLQQRYPDRKPWLLEPDARPPALNPYPPSAPVELPKPAEVPKPAEEAKPPVKPSKPVLKFEEVPEAR